MAKKLTYEELEQTVKELENEVFERNNAEEALQKSEAQYRGIFNSTTDSFLIFDHRGNIVEANPQACKMYGYSYDELIQLSGKDIVSPDYHHIFDEFKRAIQKNREFDAESVDIRKDGTPFNIKVRGTGFEYKGKPHLLAVIRDVTKEKQAEEALRESERKYRDIFRNGSDLIYTHDLEGNFTETNLAWKKELGLTAKSHIM